jgi:hypothetical protein
MSEERKIYEQRKILQIIPADGWWIGFDGPNADGFTKMVCWALIEDEEGKTDVVGLDGDGDVEVNFIDLHHDFNKYLYSPDGDPNHRQERLPVAETERPPVKKSRA